ncbi:MAG: cytochrome P450 [Pseudomonadales bacterium]|nr:cytochrome P450 [Pseudomonadales bacterium]MBO6701353.1 cytochrome P450 [Pseudomonadales bacterium]MBO6821593.1 cytochrome P450 [Pseudomonadales bacterium]MBO7007715.1 cytochrome P450 [Pseudomonadales bacterium]
MKKNINEEGFMDINYADLVKPATVADDEYFQALTAHMRANDPVPFIESDTHKSFWVATKHSDIIEIERQNDKFLNTHQSVLQSKEIEKATEETGAILRTLIHMDNPDHKKFRELTKDWFMPQNLKTVEARVQALAKHTVDRMLELGEEVDFVSDVAVWYPLRVIMMILGVPEEDEAMMLKLTQELFGADDPDMKREAETDEQRLQTLTEFFQYFTAMTADRRANPGDDVASVIANAKIDGETIGDLEAMSYYIIVATAGHDTTSSSTAGGVLALMQHPDELAKLVADPSISHLTVDEAIRWVSPVKHFLRYGTEDYELRGKTIRAGDPIMMLYPSGNRDEEVFDQPNRFISDRRPNRHLAFGHGAHHCLGNLLAKMEMKHLYDEMFSRISSIELNGEPKLIQSTFVSGLKTLPVRIKPK